MPLKFQPPNLPPVPTKEEALASTLGKSIASLPELYMSYKLKRKQQDLDMKKLDEAMNYKGEMLDIQKGNLDLSREREANRQDFQSQMLDMKKQLLDMQKDKMEKTNYTPAEKAVDTEFGKEYSDYVAAGGYAETQRRLGQLKAVIDKLNSGELETGVIPGVAAKLPFTKSRGAQEKVASVVQTNLRQILGGQFAEREGKELVARAYNAAQPTQENRERLTRLYSQLKTAAEAKQRAIEYFEKEGTLRGFSGGRFTSMSQFNPDIGGTAAAPSPSSPGRFKILAVE